MVTWHKTYTSKSTCLCHYIDAVDTSSSATNLVWTLWRIVQTSRHQDIDNGVSWRSLFKILRSQAKTDSRSRLLCLAWSMWDLWQCVHGRDGRFLETPSHEPVWSQLHHPEEATITPQPADIEILAASMAYNTSRCEPSDCGPLAQPWKALPQQERSCTQKTKQAKRELQFGKLWTKYKDYKHQIQSCMLHTPEPQWQNRSGSPDTIVFTMTISSSNVASCRRNLLQCEHFCIGALLQRWLDQN